MSLSGWFKPSYHRLLLFIAGLIIGLTPTMESVVYKLIALLFSFSLVVWSGKLEEKEYGGN